MTVGFASQVLAVQRYGAICGIVCARSAFSCAHAPGGIEGCRCRNQGVASISSSTGSNMDRPERRLYQGTGAHGSHKDRCMAGSWLPGEPVGGGAGTPATLQPVQAMLPPKQFLTFSRLSVASLMLTDVSCVLVHPRRPAAASESRLSPPAAAAIQRCPSCPVPSFLHSSYIRTCWLPHTTPQLALGASGSAGAAFTNGISTGLATCPPSSSNPSFQIKLDDK